MMKKCKNLVFDIETNGLLPALNKIHCLVITDIDNNKVYSCTPNFYVPNDNNDVILLTVKQGIELLKQADLIIGHNIIEFDIPAIKKLYPDFKYKKCFDTLIASRLIYPDISTLDIVSFKKGTYKIPSDVYKKPHSLEAWGYRLGIYKGNYGKQDNAWESWTPQMQEYCEQDVKVTESLYLKFQNPKNEKRKIPLDALNTEQEFASIIQLQTSHGVKFNKDKALELLDKLKESQEKTVPEICKYFKNKIKKTVFIPKRNNKTKGYIAGQPIIKKRLIKFNPSSRSMIKEQLIKFYGWEALEYTKKGEPKLDLKAISLMAENPKKYPFAFALEEYFIVDKLMGQLARGDKSWLNMLQNDVLYGKINTLGAVTGRCTHSDPNLAQIPAVDKPFGEECRDLFEARKGYKLVGVDAKGLELRCLAHFMNDPEYTDLVLNGDIHTYNMNILKEAAPSITRNIAKTWIYAFLYGAQNKLLGEKVGGTSKTGKKMREVFLKKIPNLAKLVEYVNKMASQGYLFGLDGRYIPLSSKHVALNYLLQSAGAIVMKKALCFLYQELCVLGWNSGKEYAFVLNVHDEIQAEVKPELCEIYKTSAINSIQKAGEYYHFNCPLDADAKEGLSWKETH